LPPELILQLGLPSFSAGRLLTAISGAAWAVAVVIWRWYHW